MKMPKNEPEVEEWSDETTQRMIEWVNTPLTDGCFETIERQVKASMELSKMDAPFMMDDDFLLSVAVFVMRAKRSLKMNIEEDA